MFHAGGRQVSFNTNGKSKRKDSITERSFSDALRTQEAVNLLQKVPSTLSNKQPFIPLPMRELYEAIKATGSTGLMTVRAWATAMSFLFMTAHAEYNTFPI